jgi:hypothetical protein
VNRDARGALPTSHLYHLCGGPAAESRVKRAASFVLHIRQWRFMNVDDAKSKISLWNASDRTIALLEPNSAAESSEESESVEAVRPRTKPMKTVRLSALRAPPMKAAVADIGRKESTALDDELRALLGDKKDDHMVDKLSRIRDRAVCQHGTESSKKKPKTEFAEILAERVSSFHKDRAGKSESRSSRGGSLAMARMLIKGLGDKNRDLDDGDDVHSSDEDLVEKPDHLRAKRLAFKRMAKESPGKLAVRGLEHMGEFLENHLG